MSLIDLNEKTFELTIERSLFDFSLLDQIGSEIKGAECNFNDMFEKIDRLGSSNTKNELLTGLLDWLCTITNNIKLEMIQEQTNESKQ
jgi:hypothetical protein